MVSKLMRLAVFIIFVLQVSSVLCAKDGPDLGNSFNSKEELKSWCDTFFFGGYQIEEYSKESSKILVVIGSHTSGLDTSYVRIYLCEEDEIELLVVRTRLPGKVEVADTSDGLEILNKEKRVLIIPWTAMYSVFSRNSVGF